jgi:hypothetical protein
MAHIKVFFIYREFLSFLCHRQIASTKTTICGLERMSLLLHFVCEKVRIIPAGKFSGINLPSVLQVGSFVETCYLFPTLHLAGSTPPPPPIPDMVHKPFAAVSTSSPNSRGARILYLYCICNSIPKFTYCNVRVSLLNRAL